MDNSKHVWNHQPDIFLENVHQVTDQLEVDHVQPAKKGGHGGPLQRSYEMQNGDLMGFYGDLMGFYGDSMGY